MKSIQPFDWNQLTKNTWDDMRDDGFKPSSHSPIIDHEIQNDIDELMNSATVAESDNWISANHFYNFDDEEDHQTLLEYLLIDFLYYHLR